MTVLIGAMTTQPLQAVEDSIRGKDAVRFSCSAAPVLCVVGEYFVL
jgi:hypothetical protein